GAALDLVGALTIFNGGFSPTGTQTWNEALVINGPGNVTTSGTLIQPLTSLSEDNLWRGPVTLRTDFTVRFQNTLGGAAQPNMTADGSGLTGTARSEEHTS